MAASTLPRRHSPTNEPVWVRWVLILIGLAFMGLFLVLPLVAVFSEAFRQGIGTYFQSLQSPDALAAIRLTLLVAAIAVPLNVVFGLAYIRMLRGDRDV